MAYNNDEHLVILFPTVLCSQGGPGSGTVQNIVVQMWAGRGHLQACLGWEDGSLTTVRPDFLTGCWQKALVLGNKDISLELSE